MNKYYIRDHGGEGAEGAEAPPDYLTVTSKKDCKGLNFLAFFDYGFTDFFL